MSDLHPRKLATAALYPRPPRSFGAQAAARISRTYFSCEPPVTPCETSIIGVSGWTLWLKGGVKSMPRVPPSGRRMYFLREREYENKAVVGEESVYTTSRIPPCCVRTIRLWIRKWFASVRWSRGQRSEDANGQGTGVRMVYFGSQIEGRYAG